MCVCVCVCVGRGRGKWHSFHGSLTISLHIIVHEHVDQAISRSFKIIIINIDFHNPNLTANGPPTFKLNRGSREVHVGQAIKIKPVLKRNVIHFFFSLQSKYI